MSDETSQTMALGWFDPNRVEKDYELVKTYLGIDRQFDPNAHYTNEFLDQSIKMKPVASGG